MDDEEKRHQWLLKGLLFGSFGGIFLSFILHDPAWIIIGIAAGLIVGAAADFYIKRRRSGQ